VGASAETNGVAAKRSRKPLTPGLTAALRAVAGALAALPIPGMVIGGIAVIARGVPRATRDVDATLELRQLELNELVEALRTHQLIPRIADAVEFAAQHQVLLLRHEQSGVDVDISMAWLPFEVEAIAAADKLRIAGVAVPIARPEDLIIYKAVAWRPQDQQDIERLLVRYGRQINLERVRHLVREFAEALDDPARIDGLEQLIARALG
jgi:predicted nucleotidyltransferase